LNNVCREIAKYVEIYEAGKYINVADAINQAFNLSPFSIESIFLSALISPFIPSDDEALAYVSLEETKKWMLKDRRRRLLYSVLKDSFHVEYHCIIKSGAR
jgi:hypothetical protein